METGHGAAGDSNEEEGEDGRGAGRLARKRGRHQRGLRHEQAQHEQHQRHQQLLRVDVVAGLQEQPPRQPARGETVGEQDEGPCHDRGGKGGREHGISGRIEGQAAQAEREIAHADDD